MLADLVHRTAAFMRQHAAVCLFGLALQHSLTGLAGSVVIFSLVGEVSIGDLSIHMLNRYVLFAISLSIKSSVHAPHKFEAREFFKVPDKVCWPVQAHVIAILHPWLLSIATSIQQPFVHSP